MVAFQSNSRLRATAALARCASARSGSRVSAARAWSSARVPQRSDFVRGRETQIHVCAGHRESRACERVIGVALQRAFERLDGLERPFRRVPDKSRPAAEVLFVGRGMLVYRRRSRFCSAAASRRLSAATTRSAMTSSTLNSSSARTRNRSDHTPAPARSLEPLDGEWELVEGSMAAIPGHGTVALDFALVAQVNRPVVTQKASRPARHSAGSAGGTRQRHTILRQRAVPGHLAQRQRS
jgi:hypothetical protein